MATTPLGYSFAPTFENAELGKRGGARGDFPQGSLQVLNFRLPTVAGAPGPNAISPLVGDQPTGGFGSAVLQSVLRTVLGPDAAAALTSAVPGAASTPAASGARSGTGTAADPGSALLAQLLRGSSPGSASPASGAPDFNAPATPAPPPSDPVPTVHLGGGDVPIDEPPVDAPTATVTPQPTETSVRGPDFSTVDPALSARYGRRAFHF